MKRRRHLSAVSALAIALACTASPTSSQLIVFDPNNYAQNVLTAARELQQINNQITSLQNQAQMLINQAKNLASLPYSSLQQLERSIQRTQQLLAQAQRIAYDIKQIDRAFSTTYAPASTNESDQALIANAQTRWQNSVAGLQDALRVQANLREDGELERGSVGRPHSIAYCDADGGSPRHVSGGCDQEGSECSVANDGNVLVWYQSRVGGTGYEDQTVQWYAGSWWP
jgi:P-type conjugative transfer protein TrbJ